MKSFFVTTETVADPNGRYTVRFSNPKGTVLHTVRDIREEDLQDLTSYYQTLTRRVFSDSDR